MGENIVLCLTTTQSFLFGKENENKNEHGDPASFI